eukprot:TRINITY_DN5244_c0_g1_i1.p1 TRINITY_DN5244_c0_g1~~TRINITY_DN5244_c0_g1_i1.p1  ORF type:complete len:207 (-),score=61.08 TRINITY_DN5244_c0_g1_i1:159-779(-)
MQTPQKPEYDFLFKLVLIGDASVGKSCILVRFADDTFTENYITTIGVDFRFRTLRIDKKSVKLQIWDTAGQERYKTITSAYYRGADGIIVVFDLTDKESFDHVEEWLKEVEKHSQPGETVRMLIGNKSDLKAEVKVTPEDIQNFTKRTGIPVVETSAKSGAKIEEAFATITRKLMVLRAERAKSEHAGVRISEAAETGSGRGCCCV